MTTLIEQHNNHSLVARLAARLLTLDLKSVNTMTKYSYTGIMSISNRNIKTIAAQMFSVKSFTTTPGPMYTYSEHNSI